ncbi:uncharacterized protein LOC108675405 isoform X1 [Hyalella azteca]|uniref:Uncharacterized protein LOC108675405 isoform X1 n=1 Tax=Hyalella azteca TaxID=294128 RepID=A0A8B7NYX6_HYAAZ|nr:uncharacterized protein LOC108675405 isoform X1 [Hyalella azteca]
MTPGTLKGQKIPHLSLPEGVRESEISFIITSVVLRAALSATSPWHKWVLLGALELLHGRLPASLDQKSFAYLTAFQSECGVHPNLKDAKQSIPINEHKHSHNLADLPREFELGCDFADSAAVHKSQHHCGDPSSKKQKLSHSSANSINTSINQVLERNSVHGNDTRSCSQHLKVESVNDSSNILDCTPCGEDEDHPFSVPPSAVSSPKDSSCIPLAPSNPAPSLDQILSPIITASSSETPCISKLKSTSENGGLETQITSFNTPFKAQYPVVLLREDDRKAVEDFLATNGKFYKKSRFQTTNKETKEVLLHKDIACQVLPETISLGIQARPDTCNKWIQVRRKRFVEKSTQTSSFPSFSQASQTEMNMDKEQSRQLPPPCLEAANIESQTDVSSGSLELKTVARKRWKLCRLSLPAQSSGRGVDSVDHQGRPLFHGRPLNKSKENHSLVIPLEQVDVDFVASDPRLE